MGGVEAATLQVRTTNTQVHGKHIHQGSLGYQSVEYGKT